MGDEAGKIVTLYGQEKDAATSTLARMNMILHNNPTALIVQGNSLANIFYGTGIPACIVSSPIVTPRSHPEICAMDVQLIQNKWRKRVGVEPTSDRKTCHPPVLKTGTITGPHALP